MRRAGSSCQAKDLLWRVCVVYLPSMRMERAHSWVMGLLGITLLVVALKVLAGIFQPVCMAIFLVFFTQPLRLRLIREGLPMWAVNLCVAFVLAVSVSVLGWIVVSNSQALGEKFPFYRLRLEEFYHLGLAQLNQLNPKLTEHVRSVAIPWAWIGSALGVITGSFFSFLASMVVVCVFAIFIFLEAPSLNRRLTLAYGAQRAKEIERLYNNISQGILAYIRVKTIISALVAGLSTLVILLFGTDLWLFWGILTFFGNFVPYIGSFLAVVCPVVILFLQTGSPWQALAMLGILTLIQRLVEAFIEPQLTSKVLNLSPVMVLIFLAFGAWLWGFVGMILAVPILVVIKATLEHIPETKSIALLLGNPG